MTRRIVIPREHTALILERDDLAGQSIVVPVLVNWPELQLSEDQILANALAAIEGRPAPFEGSIIEVEIER